MFNPNTLRYPPQPSELQDYPGLFPVDFILETVLRAGIDWFKTDPKAPSSVFGNLKAPWLAVKYGEGKIKEIADFIKKYEIRIVQHWALIDQQLPTLSIQLLDGNEIEERAALADHQGSLDVLDADDMVKGRRDVGYSPIIDNIHIGIHNINTPDLTKYLYYLVIYILNAFKPQLEERGLQLGTFRATDLSRMNDYLPENMYSRFVNFTVFSIARFDKGDVPIIEKIIGLHLDENPVFQEGSDIDLETGITVTPKGD